MPNLKKQTALAVLIELFITAALIGFFIFVYKQHTSKFHRLFYKTRRFWKKKTHPQNGGRVADIHSIGKPMDMEKGSVVGSPIDENIHCVPGLGTGDAQNGSKEANDANAADPSWTDIIRNFPRPPKAAYMQDKERESVCHLASHGISSGKHSSDITQTSNAHIQEASAALISNTSSPLGPSNAPGSTSSQITATQLAPELPILPVDQSKENQTTHAKRNAGAESEDFVYI